MNQNHRIGDFEVTAVWNERFSRSEAICGYAKALRSLTVTNVRGSSDSWLNVRCRVGNQEPVDLAYISGLSPHDSGALTIPVDSFALHGNLPAGMHRCELTFEYVIRRRRRTQSLSTDIEILSEDFICTRLDRADALRPHVMISSRTLHECVRNWIGDIDAHDYLGKIQCIYDNLRKKHLLYDMVTPPVREDYQKVSSPESTFRNGGSCANMSLLLASLFYEASMKPLLIMMKDHMMVGCWISDRVSPDVIMDKAALLANHQNGRLVLIDSISACDDFNHSFDEARRNAVIKLFSPTSGAVGVNVCAQTNAACVGAIWRPAAVTLRCTHCGNESFELELLHSNVTECPACGKPVPVPEPYIIRPEPEPVPMTDPEPEPEPFSVPDYMPAPAPTVAPASAPVENAPEKPAPRKIERTADMAECTLVNGSAMAYKFTGNASAVRIPESWMGRPVTKIGSKAFLGKEIFEAELHSFIREIDDHAFDGCKLEWIILPEKLERLGTAAFKGCRLKEIYIPGTIRTISADTFAKNALLAEAILEDGVEEISERAFADCPALERVRIPASVRRIRKGAFANCPSLRSVEIPETTQVDDGAF